jgi:hypothetical protein
MLTSMRALGVRSELTNIDPCPFQGAVETHEHPRSQPTDRTTRGWLGELPEPPIGPRPLGRPLPTEVVGVVARVPPVEKAVVAAPLCRRFGVRILARTTSRTATSGGGCPPRADSARSFSTSTNATRLRYVIAGSAGAVAVDRGVDDRRGDPFDRVAAGAGPVEFADQLWAGGEPLGDPIPRPHPGEGLRASG